MKYRHLVLLLSPGLLQACASSSAPNQLTSDPGDGDKIATPNATMTASDGTKYGGTLVSGRVSSDGTTTSGTLTFTGNTTFGLATSDSWAISISAPPASFVLPVAPFPISAATSSSPGTAQVWRVSNGTTDAASDGTITYVVGANHTVTMTVTTSKAELSGTVTGIIDFGCLVPFADLGEPVPAGEGQGSQGQTGLDYDKNFVTPFCAPFKAYQ